MNRAVLLVVGIFLPLFPLAAADDKPKTHPLYVQTIIGNDQSKPASTNHHEVGPKLSAKLSPVFKWKRYWETSRKKVQFDSAKVSKLTLPDQRSLEIERLKTGELEVRLFRKTGLVTKARQTSKDRMVILGGEDTSKSSFFVVVRYDEPVGRE